MFKRLILIVAVGLFLFSLYAHRADASHFLDYSDAASPYAWASNSGYSATASWQWFGSNWNADSGAMYNNQDTSDDGIWWSTDGSTWGYPALTPGQTFWLKFTANESSGNYWSDYVRIWVDWNRDYDWADEAELVWDYVWSDGSSIADTLTLTQSFTVPANASMGTTWLRARIACTQMGPTGNSTQGEVEDWPMEVIPEPATLSLLGLGLLGLVGFKRKRS